MPDEQIKFQQKAESLFHKACDNPHKLWMLKRAEISDKTEKALFETETKERNITKEIENKHGVSRAWEQARNTNDPKIRDKAVILQKIADLEKESKRGGLMLEIGTSRCGSQKFFNERDKIIANQKEGNAKASQEYLKAHMSAQDALIKCRKKINWGYASLETPAAKEKNAEEAIDEMKRNLL